MAGVSTFLVEPATPGFEVLDERETVALRGTPMFAVGFRNCRVPQENLLGREGRGYEVFGKSFGFSRIGNAAKFIGLARGPWMRPWSTPRNGGSGITSSPTSRGSAGRSWI